MNVTEASQTLDLIRALTGQPSITGEYFDVADTVQIAHWVTGRCYAALHAGPSTGEVTAWVEHAHPLVTPEHLDEDGDPDDDRDDLDEDDVRDVEDVVPTL